MPFAVTSALCQEDMWNLRSKPGSEAAGCTGYRERARTTQPLMGEILSPLVLRRGKRERRLKNASVGGHRAEGETTYPV